MAGTVNIPITLDFALNKTNPLELIVQILTDSHTLLIVWRPSGEQGVIMDRTALLQFFVSLIMTDTGLIGKNTDVCLSCLGELPFQRRTSGQKKQYSDKDDCLIAETIFTISPGFTHLYLP